MKSKSHYQSRFVRRIYVEGLFGQYDYDLRLDATDWGSLSKLLILYGDNGSGKTTLLRLIFHLLSGEKGRGHKGVVAKTIFREIKIELVDGTSIVALRPRDRLQGAFRMSILRRNKLLSQIEWKVDEDMDVAAGLQDPKREAHMLKTLAGLNLNLYFLTDDRRITKSPDKERDNDVREFRRLSPTARAMLRRTHHLSSSELQKLGSPVKQGLEAAIAQVLTWATSRALEGSTKGDADANALYAKIVDSISSPAGERTGAKTQIKKEKLVTELSNQSARSVAFSRFGLIGPLNVEIFVTALRAAPKPTLITLQNVLEPYIDSVKARLDALEPLHEGINSFCEILNGFYHNKLMYFDLKTGISFKTASGTTIPPASLSSGERQLLLLFCNILVARDNQSIFIIDEPELSLNVKWQRRLLDSLLEFTRLNPIQFILATHSVELLSRHSAHVVKLDDSFDS